MSADPWLAICQAMQGSEVAPGAMYRSESDARALTGSPVPTGKARSKTSAQKRAPRAKSASK